MGVVQCKIDIALLQTYGFLKALLFGTPYRHDYLGKLRLIHKLGYNIRITYRVESPHATRP